MRKLLSFPGFFCIWALFFGLLCAVKQGDVPIPVTHGGVAVCYPLCCVPYRWLCALSGREISHQKAAVVKSTGQVILLVRFALSASLVARIFDLL